MKLRYLIPAVFAVATLSVGSPGKVEAQVACSTTNVLFGGVLAATKCYGSFVGNDVPNNFAAIKAWFEAEDVGNNVWGVKAKSDEANSFFGAVGSGATGTITLLNPITGTFGISLKEGSFYSAYLWQSVALSSNSFTYTTPNGQGLSHATLWDDEGGFVIIVPEPTSFAIMFLGLAGLGVAARRRRNV